VSYDPHGQHQAPIQPGVYGPPDGYRQPWPAPAPPPPVRPERAAPWAWLVLGFALALFAGVGWHVYDTRIRFDPGLAACQAFRDGGTVGGAGNGSTAVTAEQYRRARRVFARSRYRDIRAAGTKLMDVVWAVSQLGPNPGPEAVPFLGRITSSITDLQGACANHGVIVKLNLGPSPAPTTTS